MDYIPKPPRTNRRKKKVKIIKYKFVYPTEEIQKFYLGSFLLGTCNHLLQEQWINARFYINSLDNTDCLIVEFEEGETASISLLADAPLILSIISTKVFSISFTQNVDQVSLHLYFSKLPITNFNNKTGNIIKQVFNILYKINDDCIKINAQNKIIENIPQLFKSIQNEQSSIEIPACNVQSVHLTPTLRRYQELAVSWMINRESNQSQERCFHPAYCSIKLPSGLEIYYNKYNGFIELEKPLVQATKTGGILADEMGLGKTVEILALILYNLTDNGKVNDKPMIFKQKRKRLKPMDVVDEPAPVEAKKIKVPDEFVKKGKGATYMLLEHFYRNTLKSVNEYKRKEKEKYVQCICGQYENKNDVVVCVDCEREQHMTCMGFKRKYGDYRCPQCWILQPLLKSHGTLIVCPSSLIDQWCKEICKHVKSGLSILQYEGSSISPIYPLDIQSYDIVITSYTVLQTELRQAEFTEHKSLRTESKYANPGSPITLIEWNRLCFDEAQLVESQMVAEMARRLTAIHRWAITGTPISKGLADLYILIDFLQFDPYYDPSTWENVLYKPYLKGNDKAMVKFLSNILWRTQKLDVLDQVNIPPQTSVEYYNEFNAVEKFFYDKEHELSCNDFLEKLKKLDMEKPLVSLNKSEIKNIMAPLISLRQACIHHNAVKGRYLVTRKTVNSMEQLLDALIAKNISECEDYLRFMVSAINGQAGIHILLQNPVQAVEEYRKVLQLSAKYNEDKNSEIKLGVDKPLLIHAMYNLAQILPDCLQSDPTLRDDNLAKDYLDLEHKFMEKYIKETTAAVQTCAKLSNDVISLEDKMELKQGQWYAAILDRVDEQDLMTEFRTKMVSVLENNGYNCILETSPKRLFYKLNIWEEEIMGLREEAIDAVNTLYNIYEDRAIIDKKLVQAACDCHLRPSKKNKDKHKCLLCKAHTLLLTYESKLFTSVKRNVNVSNEGTWKPAKEEHILKSLCALGKFKRMDDVLVKDGDTCIAILDILKKEFKEVRKLWRVIDQQICASDEIDICKIRMTLKEEMEDEEMNKEDKRLKLLSYEINNPNANINQIRQHELVYHLSRAQGEEIENTKMLERCIGTHKYLQTLHIQQNSGQSPDPCPICKNQLDSKWNILKCGHCYCIECMHMLLGQTNKKEIMCSICREKQNVNDINYIEITDDKKDMQEDNKVKGNCSTKVQNIVKLVMKLREQDEDVKMLIFSNFPVILKVMKNIFDMNQISSEMLDRPDNQKKLDNFKNCKKNITVLLLPVKYGSKGLNLIEATHVIFVEPLMDPADELQAVGRVHRIGQTKSTVVHKFIMKDTIEESIYLATSTCASSWEKNRVTLQQIKELFFKDAVVNEPQQVVYEETVSID